MAGLTFYFGNPALGDRNCCGKPQGCTNMNPGCAYLKHPYKRFVRGEITLEELERLNPPRGIRETQAQAS